MGRITLICNRTLYLLFITTLLFSSQLFCDAAKKKAEKKVEIESTIEDVDEDKIDEIMEDGDKHLVIFFYESNIKCPSCVEALRVMEQIDDDLEEDGLIEVVKSDDKHVMSELGVVTVPAIVYFRRTHPILYDGDFYDSEDILRWVQSRDEVAAYELDDDDFEDTTDVSSPSSHALDWFIMFYDNDDEECAAFEPLWENVAHKLRGLVKVGKVDVDDNDDVAERFRIDDDDECPEFYLFHHGKMYRYVDPALDLKSFVAFALHRYKEQRGHRVPEPPTALEELIDELAEDIQDFFENHWLLSYSIIGLSLIGGLAYVLFWFRRRRRLAAEEAAKDE